MTLSERIQLRELLARNHHVLDNQLKLLGALRDASSQLYHNDEWGTRADGLIVLVAREMVKTCAVIWEQSAKLEGVQLGPVSSEEGGRDESLPW